MASSEAIENFKRFWKGKTFRIKAGISPSDHNITFTLKDLDTEGEVTITWVEAKKVKEVKYNLFVVAHNIKKGIWILQ